MLAQTQVITVIPYFNRFIERFPNLEALACATENEVQTLWSGLGYYSRARNLLKSAKVTYANGGLPTTHSEWLNLPGIGPYTAGAIASIALNQRYPLLDGNVERVFSRLWTIPRGKNDAEYKKKLWAIAASIINKTKEEPYIINQAWMELGATVCTPKNPICTHCPLQKVCLAKKLGRIELFPETKKRKAFVNVTENYTALYDPKNDSFLMNQESSKWRKGLWDFPEKSVRGAAKPLNSSKKPFSIVQTRLTVTNHKITRLTEIHILKKQNKNLKHWISVADLLDKKIPVGAPITKSLKQILPLLQKHFPQTESTGK